MPIKLSTLIFSAALMSVLVLAWLGRAQPTLFDPAEYKTGTTPPTAPVFEAGFVFTEAQSGVVHSGTLAELPNGNLMAAWFGGSREGAADVAIHAARWRRGTWSPQYVLLSREQAEEELGRPLRKLGNPVLYTDRSKRLWLFFVTVSSGGWSTSSISYKTSEDAGRHWSPARRLVTNPFANISTLVRTHPLAYADGGIALPVYHELAGKFGELLRLDARGRVLDKYRMGSGRSGIQPSVAAIDEANAMAYLRRVGDSPRRVLVSHTADAGLNWSTPSAGKLPNPDASVAALRTADGRYLMVYNPTERGRGGLDLAISDDGKQWKQLTELERASPEDEFSYPYLVRAENGDYHLIYTWQRRRMAHVHFNQAWLEQRP